MDARKRKRGGRLFYCVACKQNRIFYPKGPVRFRSREYECGQCGRIGPEARRHLTDGKNWYVIT